MPRNSQNSQSTDTPATPATNGKAKRLTAMQKEVVKQLEAATTAIRVLHRTNVAGEETECPTGDETTCFQCQTLAAYEAQASRLGRSTETPTETPTATPETTS